MLKSQTFEALSHSHQPQRRPRKKEPNTRCSAFNWLLVYYFLISFFCLVLLLLLTVNHFHNPSISAVVVEGVIVFCYTVEIIYGCYKYWRKCCLPWYMWMDIIVYILIVISFILLILDCVTNIFSDITISLTLTLMVYRYFIQIARILRYMCILSKTKYRVDNELVPVKKNVEISEKNEFFTDD